MINIVKVDAQSTTAIAVLGQSDFSSRVYFRSDQYHFYPARIKADNSGGVYIVDYFNHRVLYFPPGANTTTIPASRVYGQRDMFYNWRNRGLTSPRADSLNGPSGIAIASDGIYIADSENNRVLFYPGISTTATRVYGQGGLFNTRISGVSANSLDFPSGLTVDSDNNLYIVDVRNHRVLFFPSGSTTPTRVYGQGGSFTTTNPPALNADSLAGPIDVAVSNNGVYIADSGNNRVLYYFGNSTTASMVYGPSNFVSYQRINPPTAQSLISPESIALDNNCNLYVSDLRNNRVLFFPTGSTTATRVYGQGGDFTTNLSNKGGVSPSSLSEPTGVAIGSNELFIADRNNFRVLKYPLNDGNVSSTGPCFRNTL